MVPPPPLAMPPPPSGLWGGNRLLAQKVRKIPGAEGAKEHFYNVPKLIFTVILWYSFVAQSPRPPRPPRGGTGLTKGGRLQGRGGVMSASLLHWRTHNFVLCCYRFF